MEQEVPVVSTETVQPAAQDDIVIVDNPQSAAPPAEQTDVAQPAERMYAGKYRNAEELERGYKEAERLMTEKAQEAAAYRKMIEAQQSQPAYAPPPPQNDFNDKFREQLAEDPAGTLSSFISYIVRQNIEQANSAQRETLTRYQQYASRPEFSDVASEVAAQLPFATTPLDPVEAAFLKARLAKLEREQSGRGPVSKPMFAESARGTARPQGGLRVEIDGDISRMRNRLGEQGVKDVARIAARTMANGGNMSQFSIDDWEKANA